jgi:hypothetical protein
MKPSLYRAQRSDDHGAAAGKPGWNSMLHYAVKKTRQSTRLSATACARLQGHAIGTMHVLRKCVVVQPLWKLLLVPPVKRNLIVDHNRYELVALCLLELPDPTTLFREPASSARLFWILFDRLICMISEPERCCSQALATRPPNSYPCCSDTDRAACR